MMKGSFFLDDRSFEVREHLLPPLSDTDVLVRNRVCGVCGSDVHMYHGETASANFKTPVVLGHEFSGVVEQIGAAVTTVAVGDRVTIDPNIYCGHCRFCRNGKKQLCDNLGAIGVNRDGGFAEYCVVPHAQAFKLGDHVDFEAGAMAEPLACCLHGIDLCNIRCGDTVLVIGGGAIGLIMVQLARLAGAACILLSEPVALRRELGLKLGADFAINPLEANPADETERLTGRSGVDVVIECVGNMRATTQAFDCADKGATVMLFSVPVQGETFPLHQHDIFKKELTVRGSFVNPDTHARAVELINAGKVELKSLITHRFPLDKVEEAIQAQMGGESIKVVVVTA